MPNWSVPVEDIFVLAGRVAAGARSREEGAAGDLAAFVHDERLIDVHSRPGRTSLVLGDVDRSEVAVDDMLLVLEDLPSRRSMAPASSTFARDHRMPAR